MYEPGQTVLVAPWLHSLSNVDNSITAGSGFQCIEAVDINGDGVDEIVKVNFDGISTSSSTTTLRITVYGYKAATGSIVYKTSFTVNVNGIVTDGDLVSPMARCYHFGDFNGDGRTQLLTISYNKDHLGNSRTSYASLIDLYTGSEVSETSLLSLGSGDELFCIDLDGDGRTELCHATASGLNIYNQNGDSLTLTKTASGVNSSILSAADYYFTDINGDGYVDIAREPSGSSATWNIYQYNGNSFVNKSITLQSRTEQDKYMFYDVNKDGLADLINRNGTSVRVYLNENGTFSSGSRLTSKCVFSENAQFVPCNVTGFKAMSDFITIEGYYVNLYKFSQDLSSERLLTKFTNSLGATTVNTYANMVSSNYVYNVDASRTYNNVNGYAKTCFPLQLLYTSRSYLSSELLNSEMTTNLSYSYFDACMHARGLGFCGFGKVRTTNFRSILNKEPVTIETRDPERMGVTTKVVLGHRMTQDNPYDITEYTYDGHTTTFGKLNPRVSKVVHTDTLSKSKSTATYAYDSYDYPTSIEVQRTGKTGGLFEESQVRVYKHRVAVSNYCLGNVFSERRTQTIPEHIRILPGRPPIRNDRDFETLPDLSAPRDSLISLPVETVPASYWIEKKVYAYNASWLPTALTVSVGESASEMNRVSRTRWKYDSYGNLLTESTLPYDAEEYSVKTYTYDTTGVNMLTATDELGLTTTLSDYTKFGKPSSQSDHKGRVTSYIYDDWGELVSQTAPDGTETSTTSSWGGSGCYTVTTSVTGKPSRRVDYDAAGREVRSGIRRFDLNWTLIDKVYGWTGRLEKVSLPFISSQGTEEPSLWNIYEYDEYQRPVSYTEASGKQTTWAYADNTTTETKNGVWSTKTVDVNGRVVKVQDAGGTISYTLRPDGQPSSVSVSGGAGTTFSYDKYGRRSGISDPSAGTQSDAVTYNPDGSSVTTHTNPNGSIVTYTDKYGRTTKVERPGEYTTDYAYDADNLLMSETSSNGTSKVYTYDSYDRVSTMKETVPDGKWLKKTFIYTLGGDVSSIKYESQGGVITTESFNYTYGTNTRIGLQGTDIRRISGLNEFGQPTSVTTGGISRTYEYNAYGIPTRRTMGDVMDLSYAFDPLTGNLLSRTDNLRSETETFGYDGLNRLVSIDGRTISYASNGNITGVDGVGTMSYGNSSRPYQVTSLTLEGDVVPSRVQNVTYTCYSRPSIMTEGGRSAAFTYNGDGARVKMNVSDGASSVLKRYYIGGQYEVDETPSGTAERLYLGGDAYSAPMVYVKEGSGSWTLYNIGRDYLGNITHIATSDGILVEENSYDPWGRLRSPETKEIYPLGQEPELKLGRGYTGHEHLTWFGLINMNARLYDPLLGRFLSPDPYVQMPDFTQNFNRYSYALNNPLVYLDQNGEFVFTATIIAGICAGAAIGAAIGAYEGSKIAERKGLEGSDRVWTIIGGGLIGGIAGGASSLVGAYVGSTITIGGFIGGAKIGAAAGATAGFINGFGMTTLETGNPLYGFNQGLYQSVIGAGSGALIGGIIGGVSSAIKGNDFWKGAIETNANNTNFDNKTLEYDNKQLGKKYAKHRFDYPNLSYEDYYQMANDIYNNPDAIIYHYPTSAPHYPGETHYIYNGNLLRLDPSGKFRSLYPITTY